MLIVENLSSIPSGNYNTEIYSSCAGLFIDYLFPATPYISLSDLLEDVMISVHFRNHKGQQETIYTDERLSAILEFSSFQEKYTAVDTDASDNVTGIHGFIPFTPLGTFLLEEKEKFEVKITGLGSSANHILTLHAYELDIVSPALWEMHNVSLPPKTRNQTFEALNYNFVCIPLDDNLREVLFSGSNSINPAYTPAELKNIAYQSNDIVVLADGGKVLDAGYSDMVILNAERFTRMKITIGDDAGYTFYGVSTNIAGDPVKAEEQNEQITDVTAPAIQAQAERKIAEKRQSS